MRIVFGIACQVPVRISQYCSVVVRSILTTAQRISNSFLLPKWPGNEDRSLGSLELDQLDDESRGAVGSSTPGLEGLVVLIGCRKVSRNASLACFCGRINKRIGDSQSVCLCT